MAEHASIFHGHSAGSLRTLDEVSLLMTNVARKMDTLCWVDIPVMDLDRAIAFYAAVLGDEVVKQQTDLGCAIGVLPHSRQGVSGCLCVSGDNEPGKTGPLVYLSVEGRLDAAVRAVRTFGGEVLREKHQIAPYGFRAIVVDSEGNRVALHSRVE